MKAVKVRPFSSGEINLKFPDKPTAIPSKKRVLLGGEVRTPVSRNSAQMLKIPP